MKYLKFDRGSSRGLGVRSFALWTRSC